MPFACFPDGADVERAVLHVLVMRKRTFALVAAAILGGAMMACAGSGDAVDGSSAAISGSLADARACAVRDAYEGAELSDIANLGFDDLPAGVRSQLAVGDGGEMAFDALGKLRVEGVGDVYVVEESLLITFLDAKGTVLAVADVSGVSDVWQSLSGGTLTCRTSTPTDGGAHPLDRGDDGGSVEIDASQPSLDADLPSFDAGVPSLDDSGVDAGH
jgi:hypothetical protein